jgi:Holliday junction resolvasome RuvABC endonuclease subunit
MVEVEIMSKPITTVVSLDPSSTAVGWAVFKCSGNFEACELTEGGVIRPASRRVTWLRRVCEMTDVLRELLDYGKPDYILVEISVGHVHQRIKAASGGAGLSIYGGGVGGVGVTAHRYCAEHDDCELVEVEANEWTRQVCKRDRQAAVAAECRLYQPEKDPGADMADAIGLALWWFRERHVEQCQT